MGDELGVWLKHCKRGPLSRVGFRGPVQAAGLRSVQALLSREEEENNRIDGVPVSFREAAVFWETR